MHEERTRARGRYAWQLAALGGRRRRHLILRFGRVHLLVGAHQRAAAEGGELLLAIPASTAERADGVSDHEHGGVRQPAATTVPVQVGQPDRASDAA